jgi:hypothetical protein
MGWAYPWHMVFFHDLYVEWGAFQRAEPIMPLGIAAILIQGFVISYLYPFYYKRKRGQSGFTGHQIQPDYRPDDLYGHGLCNSRKI